MPFNFRLPNHRYARRRLRHLEHSLRENPARPMARRRRQCCRCGSAQERPVKRVATSLPIHVLKSSGWTSSAAAIASTGICALPVSAMSFKLASVWLPGHRVPIRIPLRMRQIQVPQMRIAGVSPSLAPVADFLRKGSALSAGEWRINEGSVWIIDMRGFVGREFPHSRARNLDVDHGLSPSRCNTRNRIKR